MVEQSTNLTLNEAKMVEADEPVYRPSVKGQSRQWYIALLIAAYLPLLDGYYLSFLATGIWQQPAQALAFGLSAFSGAACLVTAMQIPGSLKARLGGVTMIYSGLAVCATVILAARPLFESLLPANLNLFTAVFLLGLGLQLSGDGRLQRVANHVGWTAVVKAMIIASLLHGIIHGLNWRITPDLTPLPMILLAVLGGYLLTTGGVLLGKFFNHRDPDALRYMRLGATITILVLGLNVLGLGLSSLLVLGPMLVGVLVTVLQGIWHWSNVRG